LICFISHFNSIPSREHTRHQVPRQVPTITHRRIIHIQPTTPNRPHHKIRNVPRRTFRKSMAIRPGHQPAASKPTDMKIMPPQPLRRPLVCFCWIIQPAHNSPPPPPGRTTFNLNPTREYYPHPINFTTHRHRSFLHVHFNTLPVKIIKPRPPITNNAPIATRIRTPPQPAHHPELTAHVATFTMQTPNPISRIHTATSFTPTDPRENNQPRNRQRRGGITARSRHFGKLSRDQVKAM